MNNQSQQIKGIVAKIDISKIAIYSQTYPKSKTLRQIINYNQRVQTSNNEQEIFKLGANLAYYLDTICDPNKGGYVKTEEEKKHWLNLSEELFRNTIGLKK
jgi:hypothetical protein